MLFQLVELGDSGAKLSICRLTWLLESQGRRSIPSKLNNTLSSGKGHVWDRHVDWGGGYLVLDTNQLTRQPI